MTEQISCPVCQHKFCVKCLTQTWKQPVGKFGSAYRPVDEELTCCACSTVNLAKHWPVEKTSKKKDMSHLRQMDFFK